MGDPCCAVIGCPALCFDWGYDEDDMSCNAMKLLLLHHLSRLRAKGVRRFSVALDDAFGLYAAEMLASFMPEDPELELSCYVPFEGQATKWAPSQRDRYFAVLAASTQVTTLRTRETLGCDYEAKMAAVGPATVILAVQPDVQTDAAFAHVLINLSYMRPAELIPITPIAGV